MPQPTILLRALGAADPVAMALKAVEEGWTAEEVDKAVQAEKRWAQQPPDLPNDHGHHKEGKQPSVPRRDNLPEEISNPNFNDEEN